VVALAAAAPAGSQPAAVAAAVRLFQFQPVSLPVAAGARVRWTNHDDTLHTVTSGTPGSPDGRFDVALSGKGTVGEVAFARAGLYPYFCSRHPSMRGEVIVR
jgi:plastocyanin